MFTKQEQEILWTKDYNDFNFLNTNRQINLSNVRNKKESLLKNGWSITSPLIVDANLNIRDGQHRFLAAKELEIEIPVLIIENYSDELMFDLNNNISKWTGKDKLRYAGETINPEAKKLIYLIDKYNLPVRTGKRLINQYSTGRKDDRPVTDFDLDFYENKIINVLKACEILKYKSDKMIMALIRVVENKSLDYEQFLNKCLRQIDRFHICNSEQSYLELFENIYNYQNSKKNYVKFS